MKTVLNSVMDTSEVSVTVIGKQDDGGGGIGWVVDELQDGGGGGIDCVQDLEGGGGGRGIECVHDFEGGGG
jgi:hypothetical protein